jgi:trans-2,3-dihydro-3-hydroxyanthranilate isomerase
VRVSFRVLDVFTDRPLAGNQLCVVPEPGAMTSDRMQAIAREIGFSETTFVTSTSADRYEMRIFTPGAELPFAGHPSLGTAFLLASEGRVRTSVTQSVPAGDVAIEVDLARGRARMEQLPPIFRSPLEDLDALAEAAGVPRGDLHPDLPPQVVSTGLAHLLVGTGHEETVRWARPDLAKLGPLLAESGGTALYLFSLSEGRIKARGFAPGVGVTEDPATGSAAGPLGAYLVERGAVPAGAMTIVQGEEVGRPSTLEVEVQRGDEGWRVWVGGGVVAVAEGVFVLPD